MSNVSAIEASLYDYLLEFGKVPGGLWGTDGAVKWTYTGTPWLNRIFDARFAADPNPQIQSTLSFYQQRNLPVTWMVGPSTTPETLARSLRAFGFEPAGTWSGMSLDLGQWQQNPAPSGFTYQPVRSQQDLGNWVSIARLAFNLPKDDDAELLNLFGNLLLKERAPFRGYLGFFKGKACATCFCFRQETTVGIFWVATAAHARRQGLASALTQHALAEAQTNGARLAVLHATAMGTPLYQKMGFQSECVFHLYQRHPEGT